MVRSGITCSWDRVDASWVAASSGRSGIIDCIRLRLAEVTFSQSTNKVVCYEFLEITVSVKKPTVENPFTDAIAFGRFKQIGQGTDIAVGRLLRFSGWQRLPSPVYALKAGHVRMCRDVSSGRP